MKKILYLLIVISFIGCTRNEVKMTDPNLQMQGVELYYKGEPFTGTLIQQIPLTDGELRIKYEDGIPKTPNIK